MNIRFPKTKDAITALLDIRIAAFITGYIDNLAFVFGGWIDRRISMPEITIPLNDKIGFWYQGVNDKLAADNVLLQKFNPKLLEQITARHLQSTWRRDGVLMNCAPIRIFGVCLIIPASSVTILYGDILSDAPPWNVVRFSASQTRINLTTPINLARFMLSLYFCFRAILPLVCTFNGAKPYPSASPGNKCFIAPLANESATGITLSGKVRTWRKDLIALFTNSSIGIIFHTVIIPWRVGVSK